MVDQVVIDETEYDAEKDTVISRYIRRTNDKSYPRGWRYSLHFGKTTGETILRYDNSHEDTKGHEKHTKQTTTKIEFPGMHKLWQRFEEEVEQHRKQI